MKGSLLIALMSVLVLLQGCTVSQQQFKKEVDAFVKTNRSLPQFEKDFDPEGFFKQMIQHALQDEEIQNAIYEQAVRDQSLWSTDKILSSKWDLALMGRGVPRLPIVDKVYIARLTATMGKTCKAGNLHLGPEDMTATERHHMAELLGRALKAGAASAPESKRHTRGERTVAHTALIAKAKEKLSDEEIAEKLLPEWFAKDATAEAKCSWVRQRLLLILDLDPKYQEVLLDDSYNPQ